MKQSWVTDGERSPSTPSFSCFQSLLLALHLPNPDPPHILPRDKDCMKDEGGPNAEEERDRYQYEGKGILGLRGWQT